MRLAFTLLAFLFVFFSNAQPPIVLQLSGSELYVAHTFTTGESFLKIGSLYNVSPIKLAQYNGLTLSSALNSGTVLRIPITSTNFEQAGNKGLYEVLVPLVHQVKKAETLEGLYRFYPKLNPATLQEWNPDLSSSPKEGTKIIVGYLRVKKELAKFFFKDEQAVVTLPIVDSVENKVAVQKSTAIEKFNVDAHEDFDSDQLLAMARKAAFDNKNYSLATTYLRSAIYKSPNYADVRIFLGRIYTWTDKVDSARQQFNYVINLDPTYR